MQNSPQQAATQAETIEKENVLQSSILTQRLNRRATEPVGLIQTKPFQISSKMVTGWIARRFGFLAQLRSRYGTHASDMVVSPAELILAIPSNPVTLNQRGPFAPHQSPQPTR